MLSAPHPFSLVLFGASGHLAQIKLYPALYFLLLKDRLPKDFSIVGFSRTKMSDDAFRTLVSDSIHQHVPEVNEDVLQKFLEHCYYVTGQYTEKGDFESLAKRLAELEKNWKDVVRLAYFSIPPTVFAATAKNLVEGGVHSEKTPLRPIVEKPVGHDLKSFEVIKKQLVESFHEDDVYLLDHYLGKEAVRNVYYLRNANPLLERLFKNTLIDHVEITASESAGLQGRAGYFEHTGTFRDMFQSHLLMIVSLLTQRLMETDESNMHSRADAMKQFYLPPASDLSEVALQGQYTAGEVNGETVPAYTEEKEIDPSSRTNTYAALKLMSRTSRWEGVPFYLRSGKRMEKKETRISVVFQEPRKVGKDTSPNRLDIILQGEAGMRIFLQTKVGGTEPIFRPLVMTDPLVCYGDCLPEHSLLLLEAIHGQHLWYLTFEEVQTAWKLVDPVQTYFDKPDTPLHSYPAGSKGPKEADEWIDEDGIAWLQ